MPRYASEEHAASKTPPEIPTQITPQNPKIVRSEILTSVPAIRGSYLLSSIETNIDATTTPSVARLVDIETTSMMENPSIAVATAISPSCTALDCHE